MKTKILTLTRIGNSQGVCLPSGLIRKHGFSNGLILEERENEIVLRPVDSPRKLSWEETYREMAAAKEDWSDWDRTLADGLDESNAWHGAAPAAKPHKTGR